MDNMSDSSWIQFGWDRVTESLRKELGETIYRSWIGPLKVLEFNAGKLTIRATSRFVRDWVRQHYKDRILALARREMPSVLAIEIVHRTMPGFAASSKHQDGVFLAQEGFPSQKKRYDFREDDYKQGLGFELSTPLDQRLLFDRFVVGAPNELAYAAAHRVAETQAVTFNPLFLYGSVGLGKTHLMHAIAWHIRQHQPGRRVVYMTAEQFMFQFIRAIRAKNQMSFKEAFRTVDVLMIDDIQFIGGRDSTQEEFFHTFNSLVDRNRQVVISADKAPNELEGLDERLRSRLGWGLVADIHPTNYELRLGILKKKAESHNVPVPAVVLEFLAHRITSNVRELEGAFNRLVAHASLIGRPVTMETAGEVLGDILRANDKRISIEDIQKKVAEHFSIRLSDMHSPRRARTIARPRQIAMYLSKQLTSRSLPEIGRQFGGRDHTTVMHAVRKVEELSSMDRSFAEDVALLEKILRD